MFESQRKEDLLKEGTADNQTVDIMLVPMTTVIIRVAKPEVFGGEQTKPSGPGSSSRVYFSEL